MSSNNRKGLFLLNLLILEESNYSSLATCTILYFVLKRCATSIEITFPRAASNLIKKGKLH